MDRTHRLKLRCLIENRVPAGVSDGRKLLDLLGAIERAALATGREPVDRLNTILDMLTDGIPLTTWERLDAGSKLHLQGQPDPRH